MTARCIFRLDIAITRSPTFSSVVEINYTDCKLSYGAYLLHSKLRSDIAIAIRALSPSPLPNWERGAGRRGEGSTIFDCNLVSSHMPKGLSKELQTSKLLRNFLEQHSGERIYLKDFVNALGDRSFAPVLLICALPEALPLPVVA